MTAQSAAVEYPIQRGFWIPTLGAAVADGSHTYNTAGRAGRYTKIGDLVFVTGQLLITSKDAAMSGALRIRGLPFTVSSVKSPLTGGTTTSLLSQGIISPVAAGALTLTANYQVAMLQAINGETNIGINQWGSGQALAVVDDTMLGTTPGFRFSLTYFAE